MKVKPKGLCTHNVKTDNTQGWVLKVKKRKLSAITETPEKMGSKQNGDDVRKWGTRGATAQARGNHLSTEGGQG